MFPTQPTHTRPKLPTPYAFVLFALCICPVRSTYELTGTMGNSVCTGTVDNGPNIGKTRAYIVDTQTCEDAALDVLGSAHSQSWTNMNNGHLFIPGCHWTGSNLYNDPKGTHGQRVGRPDQQAICSLLDPCTEGAIIPSGTECACATGVTYHGEGGRKGNHVGDITVACSTKTHVDAYNCINQPVTSDVPAEVRCYGTGVGCAAGPFPHWLGSTSPYSSTDLDTANNYMEGSFVVRFAEHNNMHTVKIASGRTLQILGIPFRKQFSLYKNWASPSGWAPGGTGHKCYPANALPRLRGTNSGRLFTVEFGATLKLDKLELAGTAQSSGTTGGAIHVDGGTFIGTQLWFNGFAVSDKGGAIYVAKSSSAPTHVLLQDCEFGKALTLTSDADYGFANVASNSGGAIFVSYQGVANVDTALVVHITCAPGKYRASYTTGIDLALEDANAGCTLSCPANGHYAPNYFVRESLSECGQCPAAFYCPNSTTKTACPVGRYAPAGSHQLEQCAACFPGKYMASVGPPMVCQVCAAGTYRDTVSLHTSEVCLDCSTGRYALDHTYEGFDSMPFALAASHHDEEVDCLYCQAGTSFATQTTNCTICIEGKYQDQNVVASAACQDCSAGRYLLDTGTVQDNHDEISDCLFCVAGKQFVSTTAQCTICMAGKYQAENAGASVVCVDCPTGRYLTDMATAEPQHDEISDCLFCGLGEFFRNKTTTCQQCYLGQYQDLSSSAPTSASSVNCKTCPPGKTTVSTSIVGMLPVSPNIASCVGCAVGMYLELHDNAPGTLECLTCPGGWYNDQITGMVRTVLPFGLVLECVACQSGKFIRDDGTDTEAHDSSKDCISCQAGQFSTVGARFCVTCEAGKYVNLQERRCVNCAVGKYQARTGQTTCDFCETGRYQDTIGLPYCLPCVPGKYQPLVGQTQCNDCDIGKYIETIQNVTCLFCPAGFEALRQGSTLCLACAPGMYLNFVEYNVGSPCNACEPGKFTLLQSDSEDIYLTCDNCTRGTFQSTAGRDECRDCPNGYVAMSSGKTGCVACPLGFFEHRPTNLNERSCVKCPAGFTNDGSTPQLCTLCPDGKFHAGTEIGTPCASCDPGKITRPAIDNIYTSCSNCQIGKYNIYYGKHKECTECVPGEVAPLPGQASCYKCLAGYFENRVPFLLDRKCVECPSGFMNDGENPVSCRMCENGKFKQTIGSGNCEDCAAGKYMGGAPSDASSCTKCERGKSSLSGSASCTDCGLGKYAENAGDIACLNCPQGYQRDETISSWSCSSCPGGFYSSTVGATYCSSCDAGTFQATAASQACENCPTGTFQEEKRSTAGCLQCPSGYEPINEVASTVCIKLGYSLPEDCRVQVQYLDDSNPDQSKHECKDCMFGADCTFSPSLSTLRPLEGYRPLKGKNSTYGRCPAGKEACPYVNPVSVGESLNLSCSYGHNSTSELCSICIVGFAATTREDPCTQCPDQATTDLLFAGAILFAVVVFSFLVWDNMDGASDMVPRDHKTDKNVVEYSREMPFHSIVIRIVSSYLQVAGMLLQFDLTLPPEVRTLIKVESSSGALGEQLLLFDCGVEIRDDVQMFLLKQVVSVWVFPFLGLACCALFWTCYHVKNKNNTQLFFTATDGFISSLMVLFFTLFPSLVNRLALSFACQKYGDTLLVQEALSVECFTGPHVQLMLAVGIPGIALFIVLIPGFLSWTLIRERKAGRLYGEQDHYDHDNTLRYGFVFAGYKPGYEWWESLIMMRKCAFVMLAIFLRQYGPACQVVAASIVLVIALSAHLQTLPYHDHGHSRLESIGLHTCILVLLATLLANLLGRETDSAGRAYLGPVATILLSVFVFGTTIYFFVEVVHTTIRASQHTKGPIGAAARKIASTCGKKCTRLEEELASVDGQKRIRIERRVKQSVLHFLHKRPPPTTNIEEHKKRHLPPLPQLGPVWPSVGGLKIHPITRKGAKNTKWMQHDVLLKKHRIVQNVGKGLVKAKEAANETRHDVELKQVKQHERLQKRLKIKKQKSLNKKKKRTDPKKTAVFAKGNVW